MCFMLGLNYKVLLVGGLIFHRKVQAIFSNKELWTQENA
jgi:hypothetical protein